MLSHDRRGCSAPAGLISSFCPSESLGEITTTARKTLNLFGIVKSYKFTKLKNFIKFKVNAVSPYFVSDHVGKKRPRQGADTFAVRRHNKQRVFMIVSPSSRRSCRGIRNFSIIGDKRVHNSVFPNRLQDLQSRHFFMATNKRTVNKKKHL